MTGMVYEFSRRVTNNLRGAIQSLEGWYGRRDEQKGRQLTWRDDPPYNWGRVSRSCAGSPTIFEVRSTPYNGSMVSEISRRVANNLRGAIHTTQRVYSPRDEPQGRRLSSRCDPLYTDNIIFRCSARPPTTITVCSPPYQQTMSPEFCPPLFTTPTAARLPSAP